MVHILIEENYAHNNRIDQILQGMASIIKKKGSESSSIQISPSSKRMREWWFYCAPR